MESGSEFLHSLALINQSANAASQELDAISRRIRSGFSETHSALETAKTHVTAELISPPLADKKSAADKALSKLQDRLQHLEGDMFSFSMPTWEAPTQLPTTGSAFHLGDAESPEFRPTAPAQRSTTEPSTLRTISGLAGVPVTAAKGPTVLTDRAAQIAKAYRSPTISSTQKHASSRDIYGNSKLRSERKAAEVAAASRMAALDIFEQRQKQLLAEAQHALHEKKAAQLLSLRNKTWELLNAEVKSRLDSLERYGETEWSQQLSRIALDGMAKVEMWVDEVMTQLNHEKQDALEIAENKHKLATEQLLMEVALAAEKDKESAIQAQAELIRAQRAERIATIVKAVEEETRRQLDSQKQEEMHKLQIEAERERDATAERIKREHQLDFERLRRQLRDQREQKTKDLEKELAFQHENDTAQEIAAHNAALEAELDEQKQKAQREHEKSMRLKISELDKAFNVAKAEALQGYRQQLAKEMEEKLAQHLQMLQKEEQEAMLKEQAQAEEELSNRMEKAQVEARELTLKAVDAVRQQLRANLEHRLQQFSQDIERQEQAIFTAQTADLDLRQVDEFHEMERKAREEIRQKYQAQLESMTDKFHTQVEMLSDRLAQQATTSLDVETERWHAQLSDAERTFQSLVQELSVSGMVDDAPFDSYSEARRGSSYSRERTDDLDDDLTRTGSALEQSLRELSILASQQKGAVQSKSSHSTPSKSNVNLSRAEAVLRSLSEDEDSPPSLKTFGRQGEKVADLLTKIKRYLSKLRHGFDELCGKYREALRKSVLSARDAVDLRRELHDARARADAAESWLRSGGSVVALHDTFGDVASISSGDASGRFRPRAVSPALASSRLRDSVASRPVNIRTVTDDTLKRSYVGEHLGETRPYAYSVPPPASAWSPPTVPIQFGSLAHNTLTANERRVPAHFEPSSTMVEARPTDATAAVDSLRVELEKLRESNNQLVAAFQSRRHSIDDNGSISGYTDRESEDAPYSTVRPRRSEGRSGPVGRMKLSSWNLLPQATSAKTPSSQRRR